MEPHPFDAISFVFGLVFVAVAVGFLVGVPLERVPLRAVGPLVVVLVGVWLLASSRSGRDRTR